MRVRGGVVAVLATLAALASAAACSAPLDEQGVTPRFDATAPAPLTICVDTEAGTGTTWTDLYRDYFGPQGSANCALTGGCHGDSNQTGALSSGYVCGPSATACHDGMVAAKLVPTTPGADPKTTSLYSILRKCGGEGASLMPKLPTSMAFTDVDMTRIDAWIQAGAPND
jgi:hypothetical protein